MREMGFSCRQKARSLNRTQRAIKLMESRLGIGPHTADVLSAREVARIFGVSSVAVRAWIRHGWLPAQRDRQVVKSPWRISTDDLLAFIENEETWVAWEPGEIGDPEYRAYADEVRSGPFPWVTVKQIALRYHYSRMTLTAWLKAGKVPAVLWRSTYFVQASDVERLVGKQGGTSDDRS